MYYADFLNDKIDNVSVISRTESTVTVLINGKERRQAIATKYGQYCETEREARILILELLEKELAVSERQVNYWKSRIEKARQL